MDIYQIKIGYKRYSYDFLYINYAIMFRTNNNILDNQLKDMLACGDYKKYNCRKVLRLNGIEAHYFIQELRISENYRYNFISKLQQLGVNQVIIKLHPANREIIDYTCNEITNYLVRERCELDHALSWLSTLGGAFSALGDYFPNAAEMAGKISRHQFKLALRLNDPTIQARCRLFLSLSLIQQGHYRVAKEIILKEYKNAKNAVVVDQRLIKMCSGIWAKLKYDWKHKKSKRISRI